MNLEEVSVWKWLWGAVMTGALPITGWIGVRTIRRLDDAVEDCKKNSDDLKDYKAHVLSVFAQEASVQASLGRIHNRLDDIFDVLLEKRK